MEGELPHKVDPWMAAFMRAGKMIVEVGCVAGETLDLLGPFYDVAIEIDASAVRGNQRFTPCKLNFSNRISMSLYF